MSLADAVQEIIANMEEDNKECVCADCAPHVRSYIRSLKAALKTNPNQVLFPVPMSAEAQHEIMIEKERQNIREQKRKRPTQVTAVECEEAFSKDELVRMERMRQEELQDAIGDGNRMVEIMKGEEQEGYFAIPATMPVGAKIIVGSVVCILQADDKLHYSAEETRKLKGIIK